MEYFSQKGGMADSFERKYTNEDDLFEAKMSEAGNLPAEDEE